MIQLFLADIDGCLSEPYVPFDLAAFARLRAWSERADDDPRFPRIGLCSGRAYAYVEATAQALALRAPALFESGGGRFDLQEARITWNPALTPASEAELVVAGQFMRSRIAPRSATMSFDYGKRSQVGIVSPLVGECETYLDEVEAFAAAETPDLAVYHTPYSIDIVPSALTKAQALRWLAKDDAFALDTIAFIGDTNGDADAIKACGLGFAPANGSDAARSAADIVTTAPVLAGVLEAYLACVKRNGLPADDHAFNSVD